MLFCVLFFTVLVCVLVVVTDLCFMDELHAKNKHNRLMKVEGAKEQLIYAISTSFRKARAHREGR